MADHESNIIKPVEGLHSITGLTPAKRREERRRQQQLQREKGKKDEELLDEFDEQDINDSSQDKPKQGKKQSSYGTGIDYCA